MWCEHVEITKKVNCVTMALNLVTGNWTLAVFGVLEMVSISDVINVNSGSLFSQCPR